MKAAEYRILKRVATLVGIGAGSVAILILLGWSLPSILSGPHLYPVLPANPIAVGLSAGLILARIARGFRSACIVTAIVLANEVAVLIMLPDYAAVQNVMTYNATHWILAVRNTIFFYLGILAAWGVYTEGSERSETRW